MWEGDKSYSYLPEITSTVDHAIALIITRHKDHMSIPILKVDRGYLVGADVKQPEMQGSKCVVRVGGGYIDFEDYILKHSTE